jgi:ERCC4-type nuclease
MGQPPALPIANSSPLNLRDSTRTRQNRGASLAPDRARLAFPCTPALRKLSGLMSKDMSEPSRVHVIVDDRESHGPVVEVLAELPNVELQCQRLAVGDYVVNQSCVFERKTLLDFVASIADGRLFVQAQKLAGLTVPAALILEGRASDLAGTQMRREALQGALVSLSLIFRLPVLRALDPSETARLMIYAAEQIRRHEGDGGCRYGRRPKRKRRIQLRLLQGLPGIGLERAGQLLATFGGVEAVMTASREELEQVDGIGPKIAAAIRDALQ